MPKRFHEFEDTLHGTSDRPRTSPMGKAVAQRRFVPTAELPDDSEYIGDPLRAEDDVIDGLDLKHTGEKEGIDIYHHDAEDLEDLRKRIHGGIQQEEKKKPMKRPVRIIDLEKTNSVLTPIEPAPLGRPVQRNASKKVPSPTPISAIRSYEDEYLFDKPSEVTDELWMRRFKNHERSRREKYIGDSGLTSAQYESLQPERAMKEGMTVEPNLTKNGRYLVGENRNQSFKPGVIRSHGKKRMNLYSTGTESGAHWREHGFDQNKAPYKLKRERLKKFVNEKNEEEGELPSKKVSRSLLPKHEQEWFPTMVELGNDFVKLFGVRLAKKMLEDVVRSGKNTDLEKFKDAIEAKRKTRPDLVLPEIDKFFSPMLARTNTEDRFFALYQALNAIHLGKADERSTVGRRTEGAESVTDAQEDTKEGLSIKQVIQSGILRLVHSIPFFRQKNTPQKQVPSRDRISQRNEAIHLAMEGERRDRAIWRQIWNGR